MWIAFHPGPHHIEIVSTVKGDLLTGNRVLHVASLLAEVAPESHVGAPTNREQGLVHIHDSEDNMISRCAAQTHHMTSALSHVGDCLPDGNLVFGSVRPR